LVLQITALRAERARLLGFPNHAAYVTAAQTARTPEAVAGMLERLVPAAARNAATEKADLEASAGFDIQSWDWAYYSEKVRAATYDVDTAAMRPYFEAERVLRDGVFFAANGFTAFASRSDQISRPTTPTPASSRCSTKTGRRSASTSTICTPATRSAAARG
jgi:peptidyl-dipeptidase Dcp